MNIIYDSNNGVFLLNTENTTYGIAIVDGCYLGHLYYGARLESTDIRYLLREDEGPRVPSVNRREKGSFLDCTPLEYPETGMGDYRESALCIRSLSGHRASELCYEGYEICEGKPALEGLPATWGNSAECRTLKLFCRDSLLGMKVTLLYSVFADVDAITRAVLVENEGSEPFYIEKVLSASIDMDDRNFEVMGLFGSWARERHIQRMPLGYGRQNISSFRGESSHQEHPFMALVTPDTTQDSGEVYAMNFVYSGNFIAQAERNQFDSVRMSMGIHPEGFTWKLEPGECFTAPEVVMVYSDEGLGKMTRSFHDLYRKHLIRSPYLHQKRPILINNWEATYFDFDEKKLLDIAEEASRLGIEMLVMDDGWFGNRSSDDSSLGDWVVNEEKIKGGLSLLVENVKKMGLKFGIWIEPEMISPESELYREHPDWAIQIPGRETTQSRAQYVLDFSREEVTDCIYEKIAAVLRSADISYVKWDMNRQLATMGSSALPADRQGELYHRYMLGVYRMQERLITDFPDILLENCSGGGARFDAGMLYYSPQIWCSDDTDAVERLAIQEGTAMLYPVSTMGAHVSVCPNHTVGRMTPFETRGDVALLGTFGYELDITKLSDGEKELVKKQVEHYHRYNDLIREGDYYRIASVSENGYYDSWMILSGDKKKALLFYVQVRAMANGKSRFIRLKGLEPERDYCVDGKVYSGQVLMKAGLRIPAEFGDFKSRILEVEAV
ncbi:MAG TPA: alpha-galactosidase [Candidatus Mediterraneibacter stercoripullorum]|nr:alpha-galactosidase [Candidatus Mediterraneibacter stercoripullorum]